MKDEDLEDEVPSDDPLFSIQQEAEELLQENFFFECLYCVESGRINDDGGWECEEDFYESGEGAIRIFLEEVKVSDYLSSKFHTFLKKVWKIVTQWDDVSLQVHSEIFDSSEECNISVIISKF